MELKTYIYSIPKNRRDKFANRCGTSFGHLRNIAYGLRTCSAELAINIERESKRSIMAETLCPTADWAFIRSTESHTKGVQSQ